MKTVETHTIVRPTSKYWESWLGRGSEVCVCTIFNLSIYFVSRCVFEKYIRNHKLFKTPNILKIISKINVYIDFPKIHFGYRWFSCLTRHENHRRPCFADHKTREPPTPSGGFWCFADHKTREPPTPSGGFGVLPITRHENHRHPVVVLVFCRSQDTRTTDTQWWFWCFADHKTREPPTPSGLFFCFADHKTREPPTPSGGFGVLPITRHENHRHPVVVLVFCRSQDTRTTDTQWWFWCFADHKTREPPTPSGGFGVLPITRHENHRHPVVVLVFCRSQDTRTTDTQWWFWCFADHKTREPPTPSGGFGVLPITRHENHRHPVVVLVFCRSQDTRTTDTQWWFWCFADHKTREPPTPSGGFGVLPITRHENHRHPVVVLVFCRSQDTRTTDTQWWFWCFADHKTREPPTPSGGFGVLPITRHENHRHPVVVLVFCRSQDTRTTDTQWWFWCFADHKTREPPTPSGGFGVLPITRHENHRHPVVVLVFCRSQDTRTTDTQWWFWCFADHKTREPPTPSGGFGVLSITKHENQWHPVGVLVFCRSQDTRTTDTQWWFWCFADHKTREPPTPSGGFGVLSITKHENQWHPVGVLVVLVSCRTDIQWWFLFSRSQDTITTDTQ